MAKAVQKDVVNYTELKSIINTYVTGQRKKIKPEVPRSLIVNGIYFLWSDVYYKFYDPTRRESHIDSRLNLVLKSKGIDPKNAEYKLNW